MHTKVSKEFHGHGKYIIVRFVDHTEGPRWVLTLYVQENMHAH